ncbi:TlpA disulfide reductase family protein [Duncaniella freteri]|uniref:TlpA disulfide reductase family protein n=1 Tax=Duncaniella freteri TaxID=2530391 RepID=UPI0025782102|nr:TlpA disulfide reductase family protein [Duncaniella freteri]
MKSIYRIALLGMAAIAAASCSNNGPQWHLNGTIDGLGENDNVILEGNNQGYWYVIDTISTSKDGKLKYAGAAQDYPDIYRLRVGESSVYFPIDSIETVTINATAPDIAANHTLSGTPQAVNLAKVDSMLTASAAHNGVNAVVNDENMKRELGEMILADPSCVVSYYIISKSIGNMPLFNPSETFDHRIIGAVANSFNQFRPNDPRTKYLSKLYLSNRKPSQIKAEGPKIEAKLIKAFEIELFDHTGKKHSLLELTESGRPVILSFTAYAAEWSPAFNVELNKVYEKYHPQGLEIYQVSVDENEYAWKQTAKNLPWVTVLNNVAEGGKVLQQYNVGSLPTTFVFNRNGELVQRVLDIADLDSAVAKCL